MKLIVFGATGLSGSELVKQALFNGHTVTAYGRNVFTEDLPDSSNLHRVQGALFDEQAVRAALKGQDAVLSAVGGAMNGQDKTRSLGMKILVQQMEKAGLKRIVALGGWGILEDAEGRMLMESEDFPPEQQTVSLEHLLAWQHLEASSLAYTVVCPPLVIPGEPTGLFVTAENTLPAGSTSRIVSGDLALFMLKCITASLHNRCRVGICN